MEIQETLKQAKNDEVRFVSLQFSDLLGVVKEVIIPIRELECALTRGVWFDGSSIEGFARIQESDLFLKPDTATYCVVPWDSENGKTVRFICDLYKSDGTTFEGDPRFILKKAVSKALELGFEYNVGPEPEFYLFKKNDASKTLPVDGGGYFDLTSSETTSVLKEIMDSLGIFSINPEASHHEVGPGQYEVGFNYAHAIETADRLLTLKYVVKKIAQRNGLHATFMAKPMLGLAGSGLHVHQSLFDAKTRDNLFYDNVDKYNLSKTAYSFIAGQMKHIKALCAILCPTVNSYKRLVSGFEAPVYITWASMNRSSLIRIPKWFGQNPQSARVELRCPDPTCNPYLAFAVMLEAGLDGVKQNLVPPEAVEENVYKFDNEDLKKRHVNVLPSSLFDALSEMKNNALVVETLGNSLLEKYVTIKTKEWEEFKMEVTPWEVKKYLDAY
ncbi:MAG: glutamine synthetase [Thaumarchaeota archaeon]|nr:glutamine synthetase [Nitrososphaerota archaeon]